jgi:hypothetical protein
MRIPKGMRFFCADPGYVISCGFFIIKLSHFLYTGLGS